MSDNHSLFPEAATRAPWARTSAQGLPRTAAPWAESRGDTSGRAPGATATATTQSRDGRFVTPQKKILCDADMARFSTSEARMKYKAFVGALSDAVRGTPYSPEASPSLPTLSLSPDMCSPRVVALRQMLKKMETWLEEFPPTKQSMRFGNKAFQQFHAKLVQSSGELLEEVLPPELHDAIIEVSPYLQDSFGNPRRIDYGTGHEAAFIAFLLCLRQIGFTLDEDIRSTVLIVFRQYLYLMRLLQKQYMLEPAGSRGVWGLDDYQFLPFIFGSSQLQSHDVITPANVINPDVVKENANRYFYVDAISEIMEMKKGAPFGECAPMLNDITLVPTWTKVNSGLQKMYDVEVLGKLPVIQHFFFGSILKM